MKTESLSRLASEETYRDVEMLIHSITHSFLRQKEISEAEYEEWHCEACMAFACSYRRFDRRKGTRFTTWLWHCVWNALSDKLRREAFHWTTPKLSEKVAKSLPDERGFESRMPFDVCSVSRDARIVVGIVLGTFGHVDGDEAEPGEVRLALYDLLSSMGWSARRIVESFQEIRVALTE